MARKNRHRELAEELSEEYHYLCAEMVYDRESVGIPLEKFMLECGFFPIGVTFLDLREVVRCAERDPYGCSIPELRRYLRHVLYMWERLRAIEIAWLSTSAPFEALDHRIVAIPYFKRHRFMGDLNQFESLYGVFADSEGKAGDVELLKDTYVSLKSTISQIEMETRYRRVADSVRLVRPVA